MDVSGEVADLMVKESIQLTEAGIRLLAAGSKNLTAFLLALARDGKRLSGKTGMGRLLRAGAPLKVFQLREEDLEEFRAFARKKVLFTVVRDRRRTDGMVDLVTNTDYVEPVNLFLKNRGYGVPARTGEAPKKAASRAPQENSSPQRGNGSTPPKSRTMTRTTERLGDIPTVRGRLAALRAASQEPGKTPQRQKQKTR